MKDNRLNLTFWVKKFAIQHDVYFTSFKIELLMFVFLQFFLGCTEGYQQKEGGPTGL